jgi:hypothetical protein
MRPEVERLKQLRSEAIERGDKALGREIFHQLFNMGVSPDEINAGPVPVEVVETVTPEAQPERAVRRPRRREGA